MIRSLIVALGAASLTAGTVVAQTPVSLTKPDATYEEPFTSVTSIRELPNGRVMVADVRDKIVQLIDFAAGTAIKVGREGQGPGEYAMPMGLFAMPSGETWINDIMGRRFLVVDAQGKPGKTVQLPNATGGAIMAFGGGGGSDLRGGYYYQAPAFDPSRPEAPPADSTAVLRWDGKTDVDTVAWVEGPRIQISNAGGGRGPNFRVGGGKEFTPREAWGVAEDGAVARVMPSPYQVIWYPAATRKAVAGPVQPYTPLKVTDADKAEVIERRKRNPGMMIAMGPGGRRVNPGAVQLPEPEFEETKPPFDGMNAVRVSPDGEVWVRRTQVAGTRNPVYDVFDRTGKLAKKVTLNPRSSVVGFGKGTVYVVRTDEDDLQYLERYRR